MRILKRLLLLILVVVLAAFAAMFFVVRRSFPQLNGEVRVSGLRAPVKVYRDAAGIPNIYASSQHDLFLAQGYVAAQDRFWQMDFWRHTGEGRLAEMFGQSQVKTDRVLRTMGWARTAREEIERADPVSMSMLKDYAEGVNAYLADHRGSRLSLEYAVLGLINRGYEPEPWTPLNSLTWGKAMSWDLSENMSQEISRSVLLKALGQQRVDELYPPYPADHPLILPASAQALLPHAPAPAPMAADLLAGWMEQLPRERDSIGSNNWVVSGALTVTGKPLLGNDPHLGVQMPSIWHQIGLHCEPKTDDCRYDVTGFSFAGVPGIIIGHNDRIAWGFTNVGPDVQDLYIEKTNPQNPDEYEHNGQWVPMKKIQETIHVAGGKDEVCVVRITRHGPVMSDAFSRLKDFRNNSGSQIPENYAVAFRWTALEPSVTFPAIWKINLARNWEEFRKGAAEFDVPSQNMVYADVEGNIGYQVPGKIPIRNAGDGRYPVPGWTDDYDWKGFIPFEELPYAYNPPEGYIATANNNVTGSDYRYLLGSDWDYGFRARRIVDLIESRRGKISVETMREIQADSKNLNAEALLPFLMKLNLDPRLAHARQLFDGWDMQLRMDRPAPALFECFWKHVLSRAFHDDLPETYWPGGGNRWVQIVRRLVQQPDSFWWDDHHTTKKETRDDTLKAAFSDAVDEMETLQGRDPSAWRWGRMHTVTFRNETLGRSGIAPVEHLFNRGPFEAAGGTAVVQVTAWDASEGYEVTDVSSMRMIVDLGNLENSQAIHTTGESGHAYHPNYIDMADRWRNIQYLPMSFSRKVVESRSIHLLTLAP